MKILDYIEQERNFYDNQTIDLPGDIEYSQSELIFSVNCARLSKYISGNAQDDIIGEYPYDNISKYRIRLEARGTDFDPKHIEVEPIDASREARVAAMIATKALQKYMRETDFGLFLDDYAHTRSEYGGFLAKKTATGVHKVHWENIITDMSDILGGVIIERHFMLPSTLKKTNWKNIDELILKAATEVKEVDMKDGKKPVDTISKTVEVWELHGEVSRDKYEEALAAYEGRDYDDNQDWAKEFVMCQIIVAPLGKNDKDEMTGLVLQVNKESELPYKYDARTFVAGRGLGEGIPEELKQHQRWHNFYKTEEARAVAIGGKVLFVTNDGNVADTVFDEGIDHGTILKTEEGKDIRQLSTVPTAIPAYQAIRAEWDASGDKVTSSFNAAIGESPEKKETFRAQYLQDANANSEFLQKREAMGRFIRSIGEDWVLPEALKKAQEDDEIFETFTRAELQLIDEVIVAQAQLDFISQRLLKEKKAVTTMELETVKTGAQLQLQKSGPRRAIEAIKEFITKDVPKKIVIHTTDEDRAKAVLFESYSTLLTAIAPGTPEHSAIIDKIMDMLGVSREQLALYAQELPAPQMNPGAQLPALPTEQPVSIPQ